MTPEELEQIHANIQKLAAETMKLQAEVGKLSAERGKMLREAFLYPVFIATGFVAAIAALTGVVIKVLYGL
jgi:cell division protein FtsB